MTYQKHVDNITHFLVELLFPSFCLGCHAEGTLLCQDCKATLEISEFTYCLCNKNPLRLPIDQMSGKCSRCQDKTLSGLYSALAYQEKWLTKKLIFNFKYEPTIKKLAKPLADVILEHLIITQKNKDPIWANSVLVPVSMELKKQKSRGYNQSEQLAKELSKVLKVSVISNALVKIKKTQPQMKLSAKERQENLKNAFVVKNPAQIAGKKIFLVDDVYTTGSTLNECARVLKNAGAKQVWGITIAREG